MLIEEVRSEISNLSHPSTESFWAFKPVSGSMWQSVALEDHLKTTWWPLDDHILTFVKQEQTSQEFCLFVHMCSNSKVADPTKQTSLVNFYIVICLCRHFFYFFTKGPKGIEYCLDGFIFNQLGPEKCCSLHTGKLVERWNIGILEYINTRILDY